MLGHASSFYRSADRDDRVGKTDFATFRAGARCVWSFHRPYCIIPFGTGLNMPQVVQMCNFTVIVLTPSFHEVLHSMNLLRQRSAAIRHDQHINVPRL